MRFVFTRNLKKSSMPYVFVFLAPSHSRLWRGQMKENLELFFKMMMELLESVDPSAAIGKGINLS